MSKRFNVLLVVGAVLMTLLAATPGASGATSAKAQAKARLCFGMVPTITGTSAGETIHGTDGNDVIWAGGGNDTVYGQGGDDKICGAAGNDTLYGGTGNDKLNGGGGNDILSGTPGTDTDIGGKGSGDSCDQTDDVFRGCEILFELNSVQGLDWTLPAVKTLSLPQGWGGADPRTFNVIAGGTFDTSYLNTDPYLAQGQQDCSGFARQRSDFRFFYTTGAPQPRLRFFWKPDRPGTPNGTGDAVLIILDPEGTWYCNDDFNGLNPQITFSGGTTGVYDVWVAKRGGSNAPGTLSITELSIIVSS